MASVNKVILVGNLGADPETRYMPNGDPITNIRLATTFRWKDKASGERREKTEWHRVVIFNEGLCRIAEQYLKKGAKVYLEGQLQTRKWQDKEGQKRTSFDIVCNNFRMLGGRADGAAAGAGAGAASSSHGGGYGGGRSQDPDMEGGPSEEPMSHGPEISDEDIPF